MDGLGNLCQLTLSDVGARRIALPEGCRVSLRTHTDDPALMRDLDWASALPVPRSLQLGVYGTAQRPMMADLQACACLRDLSLHAFEKMGTESAPWRLGGALARLERLNLVARELVLTVPSDACWPVVRWHAAQRLLVTFEDVGAFAAAA